MRSAAAAWVSRWATTSAVRPSRALGRGLQHPGARAARLGGGLVQDDHRRVGQHEPGQGELLCLGGGQRVAALADLGVQPVG